MQIRPATPGDLPVITAIYAEAVRKGTGSFEIEPPDVAEMTRRHAADGLDRESFLVAEENDHVTGFAYFAPFNKRPGYASTLEISVYVDGAHRQKGVGRALLERLVETAERDGYRQIIAVIGDSENTASVKLHAALGFRQVGTFSDVGYKHERWLDCVLMQRTLGDGATTPPSL